MQFSARPYLFVITRCLLITPDLLARDSWECRKLPWERVSSRGYWTFFSMGGGGGVQHGQQHCRIASAYAHLGAGKQDFMSQRKAIDWKRQRHPSKRSDSACMRCGCGSHKSQAPSISSGGTLMLTSAHVQLSVRVVGDAGAPTDSLRPILGGAR